MNGKCPNCGLEGERETGSPFYECWTDECRVVEFEGEP